MTTKTVHLSLWLAQNKTFGLNILRVNNAAFRCLVSLA